jgi:rhamnosyltransferase subunit B
LIDKAVLAILSAPGSRGDVNPMIAIGRELRQRGFRVVISLAEPYASLANEAGLQAIPVISRERFNDLLGNPKLWKPIRGARTIIGTVAGEFLSLHLDVIHQHHIPGQTVLVSHPLDLASRVFRELNPKTPLIDVHLAPSMLRTYDAPARMTPWWWELSKPQWLVRAAYRILDALAVDPAIAGKVNAVRKPLGLPPVNRIIDDWWLSPDRILALYPEWFAPATKQFSPRLIHCGFPLADTGEPKVDQLSERPIIFTRGTAHHHSKAFFKRAVEASIQLGFPALLLSTHSDNFPDTLPPQVRTANYLPLKQILGDCCLMVHHGGVGTTSACMAAGIPQIIRPMAFDQFDNASRVEKLGAGRWLKRDRDLVHVLNQVIHDPTMAKAASQLSDRIAASPSGLEMAIDSICDLLADPTMVHGSTKPES